jgi:hypothetical protein
VNKPPQKPLLDPDAPPSDEEVREAESLRLALEDPSLPSEAAELARAVSLAHSPRPIDPAQHQAVVDRALGAGERRQAAPIRRRGSVGARVVRISFGAGAALALAAGVAFVVGSLGERDEPAAAPVAAAAPETLIRARSTQPLFDAPFVSSGRASSGSVRIDRIAMARASDFRENEFSRWGAR